MLLTTLHFRRACGLLTSIAFASLSCAAVAQGQPTLDDLHKTCHVYATDLPDRSTTLKAERFGPCDAYFDAAQINGATAHQVLAGIHMEALNNALSQFDMKAAPPTGPVPIAHQFSRRARYLWDATKLAPQVSSADAWMVPELVTLLGSANGFDYNQSGMILAGVYNGMTAGGLRDGAEWAALTTAVANYTDGRGAGALGGGLLADFPRAIAQLEALPKDEYRNQRLYRATLGRAKLQRKSDPVASFDDLLAAHAMAVTVAPDEVEYVQLLMSNALRDNTAILAEQRRDQVMEIVTHSPAPKFKDRMLDSLATTTTDCTQVQQLFDLSRQFKGDKDSTPAAELMLAMLYGARDKADALVMRLSCLDERRLRAADSDGNLVEWLRKVYPPRGRDGGEVSKAVIEIEGKLKR